MRTVGIACKLEFYQEAQNKDWIYRVKDVSLYLQAQSLHDLWKLIRHWVIEARRPAILSISTGVNSTGVATFDGLLHRKFRLHSLFRLFLFVFAPVIGICGWAWVGGVYFQWTKAGAEEGHIFLVFSMFASRLCSNVWACSGSLFVGTENPSLEYVSVENGGTVGPTLVRWASSLAIRCYSSMTISIHFLTKVANECTRCPEFRTVWEKQ